MVLNADAVLQCIINLAWPDLHRSRVARGKHSALHCSQQQDKQSCVWKNACLLFIDCGHQGSCLFVETTARARKMQPHAVDRKVDIPPCLNAGDMTSSRTSSSTFLTKKASHPDIQCFEERVSQLISLPAVMHGRRPLTKGEAVQVVR